MMWQTGEPSEQGWYLCAWRRGGEYVYAVCKWDDNEWWPYLVGTPDTWKEIDSPQAQNETLDNLYKYSQ